MAGITSFMMEIAKSRAMTVRPLGTVKRTLHRMSGEDDHGIKQRTDSADVHKAARAMAKIGSETGDGT